MEAKTKIIIKKGRVTQPYPAELYEKNKENLRKDGWIKIEPTQEYIAQNYDIVKIEPVKTKTKESTTKATKTKTEN